jgi:transposase
MTYTRIKSINGRSYKFLVAGKRVEGKVQQKVVKYLGPINPIYKIGKKRAKTNASVYARNLTEQEKTELDKSTKSGSSFTRDRAKIILLSSQNLFAKQITNKIGCEARKVRKAIKEFNNKGLKALQRGKAKGAVPKFDVLKKKIMLMHFSKTPMSFGYHFTTWTLPRFTKHLIDNEVVDSISIEKVRQILDEAGARLKRSKRWQYSPDKDFDKKNLQ